MTQRSKKNNEVNHREKKKRKKYDNPRSDQLKRGRFGNNTDTERANINEHETDRDTEREREVRKEKVRIPDRTDQKNELSQREHVTELHNHSIAIRITREIGRAT